MASASVLNFALGETTDLLRDSIREFARVEIAPQARRLIKITTSPANYGKKWETWVCSVSL